MEPESHWKQYHTRWQRLQPPLRPNAEVISAIKACIAGKDERVLLLGVTQELANIGADVTAVDKNPDMIKHLWVGDTESRRATLGYWQNIACAEGNFSACIGDGSLSVVEFPHDVERIFRNIAHHMQTGGRFVCRLYATPDHCETLKELCAATLRGEILSFHAFKWRLAMAMVAEARNANVRVQSILERFNLLFPDREELAKSTGWAREDIDMIDIYATSQETYSFPTTKEYLAIIPPQFTNPHFAEVGSYELAERCPLLVMDRA